MPGDSTTRFSNRADHYVKSRPSYPASLITFCLTHLNLQPNHVIADIGSGTGLLTQRFLENGNTVFGVEPNAAMRQAGEEFLLAFPNFRSIDGAAEATTLPDTSIDLITAGQAYHWFEPITTRKEFLRILRPGGWILLTWNDQKHDSPFEKGYDRLREQFGPEHRKVGHQRITGQDPESHLTLLFGPGNYQKALLDNHQDLDFQGLCARALSSSYMPLESDPAWPGLKSQLQTIFEAHQHDGLIRINYQTQVFFGKLDSRGRVT